MKHSWIFRWWYVNKLRQQLGSPFKMKNEVDAIKSDCIAEIEHKTRLLVLSVRDLLFKLGIKDIQNRRARLKRSEADVQVLLPNPLFSQSQVSKLLRKYWTNRIVLVLFVTAETFLYWIVSALFIPGASEVAKIALALFLALLIVIAIEFGFEQHFLHRRLQEKQDDKKRPNPELRKQNDLRILGYILIAFSFAAIIFSGLSRIYFLENIPQSGLSAQKHAAIMNASKWASILTMVVTLITGVLLALMKREYDEVSEQFDVYSFWKNSVSKKNKYAKEAIKTSTQILHTVDEQVESHWQLAIEVKRIFEMPQEYDEKYESMNKEYLEIKSKPGFTINDHLYRRFSALQGAHEELFRFGVLNHAGIREIIQLANNALRNTDDYLAEHLNSTSIANQSQLSNTVPISSNGKSSETIFHHSQNSQS